MSKLMQPTLVTNRRRSWFDARLDSGSPTRKDRTPVSRSSVFSEGDTAASVTEWFDVANIAQDAQSPRKERSRDATRHAEADLNAERMYLDCEQKKLEAELAHWAALERLQNEAQMRQLERQTEAQMRQLELQTEAEQKAAERALWREERWQALQDQEDERQFAAAMEAQERAWAAEQQRQQAKEADRLLRQQQQEQAAWEAQSAAWTVEATLWKKKVQRAQLARKPKKASTPQKPNTGSRPVAALARAAAEQDDTFERRLRKGLGYDPFWHDQETERKAPAWLKPRIVASSPHNRTDGGRPGWFGLGGPAKDQAKGERVHYWVQVGQSEDGETEWAYISSRLHGLADEHSVWMKPDIDAVEAPRKTKAGWCAPKPAVAEHGRITHWVDISTDATGQRWALVNSRMRGSATTTHPDRIDHWVNVGNEEEGECWVLCTSRLKTKASVANNKRPGQYPKPSSTKACFFNYNVAVESPSEESSAGSW